MFEIRITGLADVVRKYKNAPPKIRKLVKDALTDLAEEEAVKIREATPEGNSGNAREAVEVVVRFSTSESTRVAVEANLDKAPEWEWIENGAPPHLILPIGKALKFNSGGMEVFASAVNHPGSEAQFIFKNAKDKIKESIPQLRKKFFAKIAEIFK